MSTTTPSSTDSVRVCVRVRPLNSREKAAAAESKSSWSINSTTMTQCVNDKPIAANSFAFDHVFEPHINNEQIYSAVAKPVVASATDGVNGVIFAYGQTAAGKTYTMLGTESDPGVTRRSIAEVFRLIAKSTNRQFLLRASYIEIYNEIIRDLLVPDNDNLKIHEDVINKRVFVDSREEVVTSVAQVMDMIARGETARAVGETNMNERSSRSHTIFSLKIESRELSPAEEEGDESATDDGVAVRASTLSLVDLAGSERASFTKAQGLRLVEGGHINKSLLTLGNVINKLSSGEVGSSSHIPYRDSKLTRLLQPALGGNARTTIICAVTPAILHVEETLSTLKFASRAKKVTNHAKTNEFLDDRAKLRRAEKELVALKLELHRLKAGGKNGGDIAQMASSTVSKEIHEDRMRAFAKKFDRLLKEKAQSSTSENGKATSLAVRWRKAKSTSLTSALVDLTHTNLKTCNYVDVETTNSTLDMRKKLLEAEKKALEAEKREKQVVAEFSFERQAMIAEVGVLVSTSEEAEEARRAAERECAAVNSVLASMLMGSLVGEIVTEAMTRSELSGEFQETQKRLHELDDVKGKNEVLKESFCKLQKEHAEVVKREKRGVGPVMKEVKILQGKLSDLEKKNKNMRQSSTKTMSEKACLEKELKDLTRQNKALNGELEKYRNNHSKGHARISKELTEEKKRFESSEKHMREEIAQLTSRVAEHEETVNRLTNSVSNLEQELSEAAASKTKLSNESATLSSVIEELNDKLATVEKREGELAKELEKLKTRDLDYVKEVEELSEELGKAQLELEEYKSQLVVVTDSLQKTEAQLSIHTAESEKMGRILDEMKEAKENLEAMIDEERMSKERALASSSDLEARCSEHKGIIEQLEERIENYELSLTSKQSELLQAKSAVENLEHRVSELELNKENLERTACSNCETLMAQVKGLEKSQRRLRGLTDSRRNEEDVGTVNKLQEVEKENRVLHENVEKLLAETKIRTREVLKLLETIQARDRKIYALEDMLDELGRGRGIIATLEQRCRRRELMIGELNRRLELQQEMIEQAGKPDLFKNEERLLFLESKNAALTEENGQYEENTEKLQKELMVKVEETRKLREMIKEKDMRRVEEAAQKKDALHEEVRRKNQALQDFTMPSS